MKDIYEKLRKRLDDLATGYPATENGVEIRILKRLFIEEEAEFFYISPPFFQDMASGISDHLLISLSISCRRQNSGTGRSFP